MISWNPDHTELKQYISSSETQRYSEPASQSPSSSVCSRIERIQPALRWRCCHTIGPSIHCPLKITQNVSLTFITTEKLIDSDPKIVWYSIFGIMDRRNCFLACSTEVLHLLTAEHSMLDRKRQQESVWNIRILSFYIFYIFSHYPTAWGWNAPIWDLRHDKSIAQQKVRSPNSHLSYQTRLACSSEGNR